MRGKKLAGLAFAALAMMLVAGSLAFACTGAQARLSIVPRSAAVGQPVTVVSEGFSPGTPVEVRWNSAAGPLVGTSTGRDSAVAVNIPADAAPGFYYLVVMDPKTGNKVGADSFELLQGSNAGTSAPSTQGVSSDLWTGFSSTGRAGDSISAQPQVSDSPRFVLGVAMVGTAATALLSGLALAGVAKRRRRA